MYQMQYDTQTKGQDAMNKNVIEMVIFSDKPRSDRGTFFTNVSQIE